MVVSNEFHQSMILFITFYITTLINSDSLDLPLISVNETFHRLKVKRH